VPPITFAHRGGRADRPENTMAAFRDALARGATGIESDVHLSGDGHPVLVHDDVLRRGVRRVRVDRTPTESLRALEIPGLADLYAELGASYDLSLDVKVRAAALPTLRVARAHSPEAVRRLWLCSPDLGLLEEVRAEDRDVRLVHSVRRDDVRGSLERHAATLAAAGIDAFNMHRTDWTLGIVTLFQRFELRAFAWDVQEPRHFQAILPMGPDAVYSDHVERMVAMVAEHAQG
jgi:glycerophosphoryl diester phosphodiesterase